LHTTHEGVDRLAALLTAGGLLTVDVASAAAETVKRGGTMVFARPDNPLTLDPFVPNDNGSIYTLEQVCDSLVEADSTGADCGRASRNPGKFLPTD
jgi:ABC-type transport system substrate-binding protein